MMQQALLWLACGAGMLAAGWGAAALAHQCPGPRALRRWAAALWLAAALTLVLLAGSTGRLYWLSAYAVALAALFGWWSELAPSNRRDWAEEVARMVTGRVHDGQVTLHNVRNFQWRARHDYQARWETRQYDLHALRTVDLLASHWMGPAIAHTLVSFGFADGRHLVFSVEIRRERHEAFSPVGGFFKQYEACIVAADERDIVRVRTNIRREDVYLYRVHMPADTMRSLFLAYVEQANRLAHTPRFYHTLTANCTTIVYHMARRLVRGLPLNWRLVLSGYLPGYLHRLGALEPGWELHALRAAGYLNPRAQAADQAEDFPARIRAGVPGHEPAAAR
ncbi:DUF4105 domain-containing protein [Orrella sp. JC864]|uniref:Lnb N-terminal periplasmic domain-containing protein n=1 Tax=Orrella sp. JC864 TaxID=3120298 RepID=UPI0030094A5A